MLLKISIDWPELALSIMPPPAPATLKLTSAPLIRKDFELALKVQLSGLIGPPVTTTGTDPVESKIALCPAETGGGTAAWFDQLVPVL